MNHDDCEEWLDMWVEDHLSSLVSPTRPGTDDPYDIAGLYEICLRDARNAGVPTTGLNAVCGGNLMAFLREEHEDILDASAGKP